MDVVTIRELAHSPGRTLDRLREGPLLVTRAGRAVAVLHALNESAFEDFVLANAPEFVRSMSQADRETDQGTRGRPLEDVLAQLAGNSRKRSER